MSGRMKPGSVAGGRVSGQCAVEQTTHPLYSAVFLSRNARPSPPPSSLVLAAGSGLGSAIASSIRRASDPSSTLYVGPPKALARRSRPPQRRRGHPRGEKWPPTSPVAAGLAVNENGARPVAPGIAKTDPPFRDPSGRTHQRGCVQRNDAAGVGRDG